MLGFHTKFLNPRAWLPRWLPRGGDETEGFSLEESWYHLSLDVSVREAWELLQVWNRVGISNEATKCRMGWWSYVCHCEWEHYSKEAEKHFLSHKTSSTATTHSDEMWYDDSGTSSLWSSPQTRILGWTMRKISNSRLPRSGEDTP